MSLVICVKQGESALIGDKSVVTVVKARNGKTQLRILAPGLPVWREKLFKRLFGPKKFERLLEELQNGLLQADHAKDGERTGHSTIGRARPPVPPAKKPARKASSLSQPRRQMQPFIVERCTKMNTNIQVGEPVRHGVLSVFPLFTQSSDGVEYQLSGEAIGAESVVVTETSERGSVPKLTVENKGDVRVLFLDGEELIGAKQNRILNTSVLVPARSKIKIPVSCVEQGRWRYRSRRFGSSGRHSPSGLRLHLAKSVSQSLYRNQGHSSDQVRVWSEVGRQQAALGACSATAAMSDTYDSYKHQIEEFQEQLPYADGACGMAVAIGEKVVSLDLFDKPSTCQKVWGRLLTGFALDALESAEGANQAQECDVRELVAVLENASWQRYDAVGEGEEHRAQTTHRAHACKLLLEGSLVHATVLAG